MSSAYQKNSISTKGAEIGTLSQITHANAKSLSRISRQRDKYHQRFYRLLEHATKYYTLLSETLL
jgi:hypothetical protein